MKSTIGMDKRLIELDKLEDNAIKQAFNFQLSFIKRYEATKQLVKALELKQEIYKQQLYYYDTEKNK